jgi:hypothetical protein
MFRDLRVYAQKKAWPALIIFILGALIVLNDAISLWRNEDFAVERLAPILKAMQFPSLSTVQSISPWWGIVVAALLMLSGIWWLAWIGKHYQPQPDAIDRAVARVERELEARIIEGRTLLGLAFNYGQYEDWIGSASADLAEALGSHSQILQDFTSAGRVKGADLALEPARKRAIERQIAILTQGLEKLRKG